MSWKRVPGRRDTDGLERSKKKLQGRKMRVQTAKGGKTRRQRWHKWLAAGGILCVMIIVVAVVYLYGQRRAAEKEIAGRDYDKTASRSRSRSGVVEYCGKAYRRSSNVKAILCIGVDRTGKMTESTPYTMGGQADGIFIIAQDTARNTLRFLIVPRDTMTEITMIDLSGNVLGKDVQHLNLAYAYGDGREGSCELVMEALSGAMSGFTFDHYIAASMDVINLLNNSVGGVTVTVPAGMEKRDPDFIEGETITLQGEQAEAFVRYRDTAEEHSAIYRLDRQKEFLIQFLEAVRKRSKEDSNTVVKLLEEVEAYMVTDMGKEEYLKVAMDAVSVEELDGKDFYTAPGQSVVGEVYNEFYLNKQSLIPILLELFYREVPQ